MKFLPNNFKNIVFARSNSFIKDSGDDMEMDDDEDQSPCNSSLIPSKDFVAPVPTIPATSALDPRLQVCHLFFGVVINV